MKIPLSVLAAGSTDSGWQAKVQGLIYSSFQDKEQDTLEKFQQVAYYKVIIYHIFIYYIYILSHIYIIYIYYIFIKFTFIDVWTG